MSVNNGIKANEKPTSSELSYVYAENNAKEFVRVSKDFLKIILGVATKLSELENDAGFVDKLVSDLENYYKKSETYTKEEIDDKLSLVPRFSVQVVSSGILPTEDISETTVYLIPSSEEDENLYTEFIYVNGFWEILGTQRIAQVNIDKTLSVDGQAADAKIVGDKFKEMQQSINEIKADIAEAEILLASI